MRLLLAKTPLAAGTQARRSAKRRRRSVRRRDEDDAQAGRRPLGNGNGNGHAVFPPGPISTITRYEQPPPPRALGHRVCSAASCSRRCSCCSRSGSRPRAAPTSGSTSRSRPCARLGRRRSTAQKKLDVPLPRPGRGRARRRLRLPARRRPHGLALGHADADPRRPVDEVDLDALVPARPDRPRLLPGPDTGQRPHQLGVLRAAARRERSRPCGS